jgi:nifR3 family TIM-barrel protein
MIQLKNFTLKSNVVQSPMAGCTDLAFRLIAREHGMEFAFLEMVYCEPLIRGHRKTLRFLKRAQWDKPLGAQLLGSDPENMGKAAVILEDMGFDVLDINLGCPVRKVVAKGDGSALLKKPENAQNIFESVMRSVKKIPVTVKMRTGFTDPSGDEAVRIAKIAEASGISAIFVHGRTREQLYTGKADWQAIGRVKDAVKIPVFGNGDVTSGEDALELMKVSRSDGIMIGRAGLGNPWIYKEIESAINGHACPARPSFEEQKRIALKHIDLEVEFEGEAIGILKCRRIACWYFKDSKGSKEFRDQVNRTTSLESMRRLINEFPFRERNT